MIDIDRDFYKKTFQLVLPIAIQNFIFYGLNMVDTMMIGQLGKESLAGVSLANQYLFVLVLIFFGITGGAALFTSQYWGADNIKRIHNIYAVSLKLACIVGLLFSIPALFFPGKVLSIFTNDESVIYYGSKYIRIVSFCYITSGLSFITAGVLRSIGTIKLPMVISGISLILNTLLNYLLIFGKFNFPKLGVEGAAIATVISRTIEILLFFSILRLKKHRLIELKLKDFLLSRSIAKTYYSKVVPVVINETMWSLGTAAYSALFAHISTSSIAAYQIQQTTTNIFLVFIFGIGNASSIIIGNSIGEGNLEKTFSYSTKFLKLSTLLGILTGLVITLLSPYIVDFYNVPVDVLQMARKLIYIFSIILLFKSINITIVVGLLRGGGDTKVAMFMDIVGVWMIGIPLGLISAFILKLEVQWVYLFITFEELVKTAYGLYRIQSKKWINNLTT